MIVILEIMKDIWLRIIDAVMKYEQGAAPMILVRLSLVNRAANNAFEQVFQEILSDNAVIWLTVTDQYKRRSCFYYRRIKPFDEIDLIVCDKYTSYEYKLKWGYLYITVTRDSTCIAIEFVYRGNMLAFASFSHDGIIICDSTGRRPEITHAAGRFATRIFPCITVEFFQQLNCVVPQ